MGHWDSGTQNIGSETSDFNIGHHPLENPPWMLVLVYQLQMHVVHGAEELGPSLSTS